MTLHEASERSATGKNGLFTIWASTAVIWRLGSHAEVGIESMELLS